MLGDFWCASFVALASEFIAKRHEIDIQGNITAAGHRKYIHDQIGGGTKSCCIYAVRNDHIQIQSGRSFSNSLAERLNKNHDRFTS